MGRGQSAWRRESAFRRPCTWLALVATVSFAGCGRISYDPGALDASAPAPDASAPSPDSTGLALACSQTAEVDTVALYDFNSDVGSTLVDQNNNNNPGVIVGTLEHTASVAPECGQALRFAGSLENYATIPDSAAWISSAGSVDLWFRIDALPVDLAGLVSKDATGTAEPGHLSILVDSAGRLAGRVQAQNAANVQGLACSGAGAIVPGEWNHVGLNYDSGALLEVWLNSSRVDVAGMFGTLECQTAAMSHIDNREPWALGVSAMTSNSGSVEPPAGPLTGAIDHLRIHGAKRDFSGPEYRVGPP